MQVVNTAQNNPFNATTLAALFMATSSVEPIKDALKKTIEASECIGHYRGSSNFGQRPPLSKSQHSQFEVITVSYVKIEHGSRRPSQTIFACYAIMPSSRITIQRRQVKSDSKAEEQNRNTN